MVTNQRRKTSGGRVDSVSLKEGKNPQSRRTWYNVFVESQLSKKNTKDFRHRGEWNATQVATRCLIIPWMNSPGKIPSLCERTMQKSWSQSKGELWIFTTGNTAVYYELTNGLCFAVAEKMYICKIKLLLLWTFPRFENYWDQVAWPQNWNLWDGLTWAEFVSIREQRVGLLIYIYIYI